MRPGKEGEESSPEETSDGVNGENDDCLERRIEVCRQKTAGAELDLSKLELTEFPVEIFALFPTLRKLNLRKNGLKALPDELSRRFPHLTSLNVAENELTILPEEIGAFKHLQKLSLERNALHRLPASMAKLENLEELNLKDNHLKMLCDSKDNDEFGAKFMRLKVLQVANNQLELIPRSFGELPCLKTVDLSGNGEIDVVPEKVRRLHERNVIVHSRSKRRELISRALRVRRAVAHTMTLQTK
ncbi:TPA: hypothetical protein N0F65_002693 [Lagenidium giganteum]|uniref:Uncharacterized protein n=1 Tax=Lagenidium giganteum TaxID=4803 RepID=A0AAV2Z3V2_9STRA|nr:TPA: hypothetical protein N0F65_002693 [Lagenidium giganteum]